MSVEDNYEWWIVLFVAFKGLNQNYGRSLPRHETSSWKVVVKCLVNNTEEGSLEWRLEHVRVSVGHVHEEVYFVEVIKIVTVPYRVLIRTDRLGLCRVVANYALSVI